MAMHPIVGIGRRRVIYLDAGVGHLTPDQARAPAAELVAAANEARRMGQQEEGR